MQNVLAPTMKMAKAWKTKLQWNLLPKIKRLPSYLVRFGCVNGVRNFLQSFKSAGMLSMSVRGLPHPILLRGSSSDLKVFEEVFLRRCYAIESEQPGVIVDAGANIGLASLFFVAAYPGARVIAIEPEQANCEMLKINTAHYPQISILHAALWGSDASVEIRDPGRGSWAFQVGAADPNPTSPITGISVDSLMKKFALDSIDLLKIDIEGGEKELFASGAEWLSAINTLIIELHDRFVAGCSAAMYSAIGSRRFTQEYLANNVILRFGSRSGK